MEIKTTSIEEFFGNLTDCRSDYRTRHLLIDILTIALCAVISGAESFGDIWDFADCKKEWFGSFLRLPNGIPSHDTFNRVFSMLSPKEFSECFAAWTKNLAKNVGGVIAIDGKTLRRSLDKASNKAAIHMVSAWSVENGLVLGQTKTDAKSNEITAIPKLLELLDIKDCVVTIDAMGCQKEIAQQITERGGDYVLGLKGNQGNAHEMAKFLFELEEQSKVSNPLLTVFKSVEKDHGRIETRECHCLGGMSEVEEFREWVGINSVCMVLSHRLIGDKGVCKINCVIFLRTIANTGEFSGIHSLFYKAETTEERRYYLSSLNVSAEEMGKVIRSHWGIENSLHWVLDVNFREDEARNSAANMAVLRHMAAQFVEE